MRGAPPAGDRPSAEREPYSVLIAKRRELLQRQLVSLFSSPTNFIWELGCGHGHFLTAFAQAHPDKICIGIDIVSNRIERACRKRDRARLGNLFFIRAEARLFMEALPAGTQFSDLFILFPDPWPKLRHHKHRIMQPDFLSAAASRASAMNRLWFRTDSDAYFDQARRVVAEHPNWKLLEEQWPFEFRTVFQERAVRYQSLVAAAVRA